MKVGLIGPIRHWYTEWGSERHQQYIAWREELRAELVLNGHLVYDPHLAWQGPWDEVAQAVTDRALEICDVVLNMTPDGVPSPGTAGEMRVCSHLGKPVLYTPPPDYFPPALSTLITQLLPLHRTEPSS